MQKRMQDQETELKQSEIQVRLKEEEKKKELETLKDFYSKKIEDASKRGQADSTTAV